MRLPEISKRGLPNEIFEGSMVVETVEGVEEAPGPMISLTTPTPRRGRVRSSQEETVSPSLGKIPMEAAIKDVEEA